MKIKIARSATALLVVLLIAVGVAGCARSPVPPSGEVRRTPYLPYTEPISAEARAESLAKGGLTDPAYASLRDIRPVIDGHELLVWNDSGAARVYVTMGGVVTPLGTGPAWQMLATPSVPLSDQGDHDAYEIARLSMGPALGNATDGPATGGLLAAHGVRFDGSNGSHVVVRVDVGDKVSITNR